MGHVVDGLRALTGARGLYRLNAGWTDDQDTLKEAPKTRVRRGKVVEIPEEWRGKVVYGQEIRARKTDAKLKHGNGKGLINSKSSYIAAPTRRKQRLDREFVRTSTTASSYEEQMAASED